MGYRKYSWIFESDPGTIHQAVPSWVAGSVSRVPGSGRARVSVLYIDDEPDLLNLGKQFLERSGILAVETAESGEAGLRRLRKGKIDVIVSDYQMAGIDGIDVLKEIRSSGNATPFIIFTGKGREEVVIDALNEGADFYLQKGGDPRSQFMELEHKILQAYRRQHAEREVLESRALLSTVFESIADGILVIGSGRKIAAWNGQFLKMWQIPPECIEMRDLEPVLEIICSQINTPDSLLQQINGISSQPDRIRQGIFVTKAGRTFEWYLQPQWIENEIIGGILSFRDVTARVPDR